MESRPNSGEKVNVDHVIIPARQSKTLWQESFIAFLDEALKVAP